MAKLDIKIFDQDINISGQLYDTVKIDNSIWTIEDDKQLIITLEK